MTSSRTAKLAGATLGALVLCVVAVVALVRWSAPEAAYECLGWIALSIAGGGGLGTLAHGARHVPLPGAPRTTEP